MRNGRANRTVRRQLPRRFGGDSTQRNGGENRPRYGHVANAKNLLPRVRTDSPPRINDYPRR